MSASTKALFVTAFAVLGVACSADRGSASDSSQADSTRPLPDFANLVDPCLVTGVGAAAVEAYADSPLQHLYGLSVDGELWESGMLTIAFQTGNDEDGETTRRVTVDEEIDYTTGNTTCTVKTIDGKAPGLLTDSAKAYAAIIDPCTQRAVEEANRVSDNYWHLEDIVVDGDLAADGVVHYKVTAGNAEDGDTTYDVDITQTFDRTTGATTCETKGATMEGGD